MNSFHSTFCHRMASQLDSSFLEETGGDSVVEGKEPWAGVSESGSILFPLDSFLCDVWQVSSHFKPQFPHLWQEGLD